MGGHQRGPGQEPGNQLLSGHFQREDGHGFFQVHGRIEGQVQGDAGFAHAGTSGNQDQLRFVQAQGHPVQIRKARADTGDLLPGGCRLGQGVKHVLHHCGYRHQAAHVPTLAQGIDPPLSGFQHGLRLAGAFIHHVVDLVGGFPQTAQQGPVTDNGGVFQHVCRRGRDAHHLRHVALIALLVHAPNLHLVQHGHRVDGLAVGEHGVDGLIDIPVELDIKLIGLQLFQHLGDTPGINEHGADHSLLRRGGVGRLSAKQLVHRLNLFNNYPSTTSTFTFPLIS